MSSSSELSLNVNFNNINFYKFAGPPEELRIFYAGNDFIDLEWSDTRDNAQCITGVATFCRETNETRTEADECEARAGDAGVTRQGRVTHLNACTRYKCWSSYSDTSGDWSLTSNTCVASTWSQGVEISGVTSVAHVVHGSEVTVTWAGVESGHR